MRAVLIEELIGIFFKKNYYYYYYLLLFFSYFFADTSSFFLSRNRFSKKSSYGIPINVIHSTSPIKTRITSLVFHFQISNERFMPIVRRLLGDDCILGLLSAHISLPGSDMQPVRISKHHTNTLRSTMGFFFFPLFALLLGVQILIMSLCSICISLFLRTASMFTFRLWISQKKTGPLSFGAARLISPYITPSAI